MVNGYTIDKKKKINSNKHHKNVAKFIYSKEVMSEIANKLKRKKKKSKLESEFIKLSDNLKSIKLSDFKL